MAEIIYVNASSIAGAKDGARPLAQFTDARTTPIVARATDYRAAILRFQCTGLDLPVFMPQIADAQLDPKQTTLAVGCRAVWYDNNDTRQTSPLYRRNVQWVPERLHAPAPSMPGAIDVDDDYYWARTIGHVTDNCIQPALNTVVDACVDAVSATYESAQTAFDDWLVAYPGFATSLEKALGKVDSLLDGLASEPALMQERADLQNEQAAFMEKSGPPPYEDPALQQQFDAFTNRIDQIEQEINTIYANAAPYSAEQLTYMQGELAALPSAVTLVGTRTPRLVYKDGKLTFQVWEEHFDRRYLGLAPFVAWLEITWNAPLMAILGGFTTRVTRKVDAIPVAVTVTPGIPDFSYKYTGTTMDNPVLDPTRADCVYAFHPRKLDNPFESTSTDMWEVPQEFNSTDAWSPIDCLVFTSTMPLQQEVASTTNFLIGSGMMTNSGSSNSTIPSFTDLSLSLGGGATDYLGKITYAPTAQYRWLEFTSAQALSNISFQLLWRHRVTDRLYPVFLKPAGSVQMKLLLQRKY